MVFAPLKEPSLANSSYVSVATSRCEFACHGCETVLIEQSRDLSFKFPLILDSCTDKKCAKAMAAKS